MQNDTFVAHYVENSRFSTNLVTMIQICKLFVSTPFKRLAFFYKNRLVESIIFTRSPPVTWRSLLNPISVFVTFDESLWSVYEVLSIVTNYLSQMLKKCIYKMIIGFEFEYKIDNKWGDVSTGRPLVKYKVSIKAQAKHDFIISHPKLSRDLESFTFFNAINL